MALPKRAPSITPSMTVLKLKSGSTVVAGTKGLWSDMCSSFTKGGAVTGFYRARLPTAGLAPSNNVVDGRLGSRLADWTLLLCSPLNGPEEPGHSSPTTH